MENKIIEEVIERVILVGVETQKETYDIRHSLIELEDLAKTAGAETVGKVVQKREGIHPATYVGKGKIEEIRSMIWELDATGIVIDDELSPAQYRNLGDALDTKIMDRTMVILDIFAQRAHSKDGKIQVELAQLQYKLNRLAGVGKEMSRLGAGIGTRGPGETKLETDKRHIREKISALKKELSAIVKHRDVLRTKRKENKIPIVALVGYTNAGKSTIFNRLTDAGVLEEDKLFATLDTTTRNVKLPSGTEILLIDTVGFINKLPHHLVKAFHSTLEEAKYADLLLHAVDVSNEFAQIQMNTTQETLESLGISHYPIIDVFNKVDLQDDFYLCDEKATPIKSVKVSALTGQGFEELKQDIEEYLLSRRNHVKLLIPYSNGDLINIIRKNGQIISEEYKNEGTEVEAYVEGKIMSKIETYIVD